MVVTLTSGNNVLKCFGDSSPYVQFRDAWYTVVHWTHYYRPYPIIFSNLLGYFHKQEFGGLDIQLCATHFEFGVIYILLTVSRTIGGFSSVCSNKGKQIYPWQKSTAWDKIFLSLPQTNQEGKSFNPVVTQKQWCSQRPFYELFKLGNTFSEMFWQCVGHIWVTISFCLKKCQDNSYIFRGFM